MVESVASAVESVRTGGEYPVSVTAVPESNETYTCPSSGKDTSGVGLHAGASHGSA